MIRMRSIRLLKILWLSMKMMKNKDVIIRELDKFGNTTCEENSNPTIIKDSKSIVKIPWCVTLMDKIWIFNNPIQKYINKQMDKQPDISREDEFLSTINEDIDIMPSYKSYKEWKSSLITGDLILPFQESRYKEGYKKYIIKYRKELRDWYNRRKEKYRLEHPEESEYWKPKVNLDEDKLSLISTISNELNKQEYETSKN